MAQMKGIDISSWQRGLDLSKIKFDFVICKATEGLVIVDSCCDGFIKQAQKLGKPFGFYHFARPESNTAQAEAEYFYKHTKGYFGYGIPVLDWESSGKANIKWAKQWLDAVYKLSGVKPLIYMSESVVNSYNWSSVAESDYGLWVAKYYDYAADWNYDMSNAGSKPNIKWWKTYAMWQWTSSGRLNGYSGNLDCDVFYGDAAAWKKYTGKGSKRNQWEKNNNEWYYYDANGKPVTGWHKLNWSGGTSWFYFNTKGVMQTGWQKLKWSGGESWFYFDAKNGAMLTGWQKLNWSGGTSWFYFDSNGAMLTGWIRDKNNMYYCDPKSGAMLTGNHTLPCYFNDKGILERK